MWVVAAGVAETLVKNQFGRHARIGTAENNGRGRLLGHQFGAAGVKVEGVNTENVIYVALITCPQARQRF